MSDPVEINSIQSRISKLNDALLEGSSARIKSSLEIINPPDTADLIEASPSTVRTVLWNILNEAQQTEVLQFIDDNIVRDLLSEKSGEEIAHVLENLDSDEITDILQSLPEAITHQVLQSMDTQNRARIENLLSYPEDTAGGLMDIDTISVRAKVTLDVVFRYLRRHSDLPPMTDNIFVVNSEDEYVGLLPVSQLLVSDPHMTVREMMNTDIKPIAALTPATEVTSIFEKYDLVSAPVVDTNMKLLGRITIDDVVDVIIEEADHFLLAPVGLTENEDSFAPILKTARNRAFWLGTNLITAFIASAVINLFEDTIDKVVALAILMPIVASMGGVAGSQTLTLVIRNMAQSKMMKTNERWLLRRELAVGVINGCLWASVVAVGASFIFQSSQLGMIIAIALAINLTIAALAGALLPGILRSLGVDPAIAGTVLLTTITDVVGFMSFLGLATIFYA